MWCISLWLACRDLHSLSVTRKCKAVTRVSTAEQEEQRCKTGSCAGKHYVLDEILRCAFLPRVASLSGLAITPLPPRPPKIWFYRNKEKWVNSQCLPFVSAVLMSIQEVGTARLCTQASCDLCTEILLNNSMGSNAHRYLHSKLT